MRERSSFLLRIFVPHVIVCCAALLFIAPNGCRPAVYWVPAAAALWPLAARLCGLLRGIRRDYLASLTVVSLLTLVAAAAGGFGAFVMCGRIG